MFKAEISPSSRAIILNICTKGGFLGELAVWICTRDFTTSNGNMAIHNATPPIPPLIIVLTAPIKYSRNVHTIL